jgi:nitrogen regulatory protein PII
MSFLSNLNPWRRKLHLITAIVQSKDGKAALDAALQAGANGATYFHAQGTGVRQALGEAGREIEVDKRVILIVADSSRSEQVLAAVVQAARLEEPGQGFAFVQQVEKAIGFVSR